MRREGRCRIEKVPFMMRFGLVGGKRWLGKHFILGMVAVAGLLGGWALLRASADSRSRTIRLADGRKFTLRAVTFGTEHRYVHGASLRLVRLLARTDTFHVCL